MPGSTLLAKVVLASGGPVDKDAETRTLSPLAMWKEGETLGQGSDIKALEPVKFCGVGKQRKIFVILLQHQKVLQTHRLVLNWAKAVSQLAGQADEVLSPSIKTPNSAVSSSNCPQLGFLRENSFLWQVEQWNNVLGILTPAQACSSPTLVEQI